MSARPVAGGGRRRAAPPAAAATGRGRLALVVLSLGCLAALLAVATTREVPPPPDATAATSVVLDEVSSVCPVSASVTEGAQDTGIDVLGLALAPEGAGEVVLRALGQADGSPQQVAAGGLETSRLPAEETAVVDATAGAAASLRAWTASVAGRDQGRGLLLAECPRPAAEQWYVGVGSSLERDGSLLLANPGPTTVVADVVLLSAEGEQRPSTLQGVVLEAGGSYRVELASVAAGDDDVALGVRSVEGRVVSAYLDRWGGVGRAQGSDWVPATVEPSTRSSVPGVLLAAGRGGGQRLVVANPGDRAAVVRVQVSAEDSTYVPEGLEELVVEPGTSTGVDLPPDLDGELVGLLVESDQPVLSSVRSTVRADRLDVATAVAADPLSEPVGIPVGLTTSRSLRDALGASRSTIALAGLGGGSVRLVAYDRDGEQLATAGVEVADDVTIGVRLGRGGELGLTRSLVRRLAQVVVEPVSGGVGGALVVRGDAGATVVGLRDVRETVQVPAVSAD